MQRVYDCVMPDDTTIEWVTTAEAQRLTEYNLDHLRRLCRDGDVIAEKRFGVVWLINKTDLLRHKAEARSGPKRKS